VAVLKICGGCHGIFPPSEMSRSRRGRCLDCAKKYERDKSRARRARKGTTAQRGYGVQHEQLRKVLERRVAAGLGVCARCHKPIAPGTPWDLDHADDRRGYLGPSHRACNRSTRKVATDEGPVVR
jgi:hypothetical protein